MNPTNSVSKRRNPWPIVIVAYFAVFIAFLVTFIVYASTQRVDLVRRDYYEEEIRFQEQLERVERARQAGISLAVAYDQKRDCLTLSLAGAATNSISGRIHLYRPSDARLDQEYPLLLDKSGSQSLAMEKLQRGLWKVRVRWTMQGEEYYLEQRVLVEDSSRPAGRRQGTGPGPITGQQTRWAVRD
jgi:nitrogen fixation protein FixH